MWAKIRLYIGFYFKKEKKLATNLLVKNNNYFTNRSIFQMK